MLIILSLASCTSNDEPSDNGAEGNWKTFIVNGEKCYYECLSNNLIYENATYSKYSDVTYFDVNGLKNTKVFDFEFNYCLSLSLDGPLSDYTIGDITNDIEVSCITHFYQGTSSRSYRNMEYQNGKVTLLSKTSNSITLKFDNYKVEGFVTLDAFHGEFNYKDFTIDGEIHFVDDER